VYVQIEWWGADVVICLEQGEDLHIAQLMPLPLTLASVKSRLVLPFWYWLTWVDPEKGPLNGCVCVCVCVCVCSTCFTVRRYASEGTLVMCPSVRPPVSLLQAGIVSKRLNESSWFLAPGLPSTTVL